MSYTKHRVRKLEEKAPRSTKGEWRPEEHLAALHLIIAAVRDSHPDEAEGLEEALRERLVGGGHIDQHGFEEIVAEADRLTSQGAAQFPQ